MPLVERRYAEALVDISVQNGAIEAFQGEFQSVVSVYDTQPDFKLFLLNPEIRTEVKKDIMKKLFSSRLKGEMVSFLMLLLDKGRIKFLPGIFEEFVKLADKKKNVLDMTIIAAAPIGDKQVDEIKQKYIKLYKASSAKVKIEVDGNLIGGVKVKVGDRVTDGSIKGRLEALKDILIK
jgi:F-type H+-transporting ATPase subunit delta